MSMVQSVIMGLIQGVTEFLPVSSSGHLALFKILFNVNTDTLKANPDSGSMFVHQFRNCISAHFHCIHSFSSPSESRILTGSKNSDSSYFSVIKFASKCV